MFKYFRTSIRLHCHQTYQWSYHRSHNIPDRNHQRHDDYNITSGTFTCSINGVYFFVLTMYKYSIADFAYCNIRHNGTDVVEAYSNPNVKGDYGFYSASTTLYIHLESGDTIDLGHCTAAGTLEYRTTFTGFLVNAD